MSIIPLSCVSSDFRFSSWASSEQLAKLAKVIMTLGRRSFSPVKASTRLSKQLTAPAILAVTLNNANVWELRRFRGMYDHLLTAEPL